MVGTVLVSILLIAGALGIGSHSLSLLLSVLSETAASMPASPLQTALLSITAAAHNVPGLGLIAAHSLSHGHGHVLDLNAAWFAAASIVSKEWLFRIRVRLRSRRIVLFCLRMRIIIGVMLIRALSHWVRFSEVVGSLRCHWTPSEVRISSHTVHIFLFLCFFAHIILFPE